MADDRQRAAPPVDPSERGRQRQRGAYADCLGRCAVIGFVFILATFLLYVAGRPRPHLAAAEMSRHWGRSAAEFAEVTGLHGGWEWLRLVGRGDYLNFLGIAFLGCVSIICYARLLPLLLKDGDKTLAVIAVVQLIILLVAASGVLTAGQ